MKGQILTLLYLREALNRYHINLLFFPGKEITKNITSNLVSVSLGCVCLSFEYLWIYIGKYAQSCTLITVSVKVTLLNLDSNTRVRFQTKYTKSVLTRRIKIYTILLKNNLLAYRLMLAFSKSRSIDSIWNFKNFEIKKFQKILVG